MSAVNQLSLDFDVGLVERHKSCMDCIRQAAYTNRSPLKTIAADMDLSESELSRKLAQNPNDTRHFNLEDLERFVVATGDTTPILYLVGKYLADQQTIKQAAMQRLMKELPDVLALIKTAMHEQSA